MLLRSYVWAPALSLAILSAGTVLACGCLAACRGGVGVEVRVRVQGRTFGLPTRLVPTITLEGFSESTLYYIPASEQAKLHTRLSVYLSIYLSVASEIVTCLPR